MESELKMKNRLDLFDFQKFEALIFIHLVISWYMFQSRIEELKTEKEKAELDRAEKLASKETAEAPEKEALEQYKAIEEEIKARKEKEQKEKDINDAKEAFAHLDADGDGILTIQELQSKETFDTNKDGEVSEDEAKVCLYIL